MLPILTPATLALLALLGKATLLLVVAFAGATVLQRAPAGARHLLWLSTLGAILALPAIATWSPLRLAVIPGRWVVAERGTAPERSGSAPLTSSGAPSVGAAVEVDAGRDGGTAIEGATPPESGRTAAAAPRWRPSAWQGAFLAWATVALAIGAWLVAGFLSVRRIVRRATPLTAREWSGPLYDIADRLGIERTPQLVRSEDVKMPFAAGLASPTVVLPAECDTWDEARRRAVLLHELAHVARNDLLGHTLGRLACALYWFHPLVWGAARRLRLESERACDDLALSCGVRPSSYAEHLLDIVTSVRQPLTPAVAIPMADRREFEGRMLAILDPDVRRHATRRQSMTVVAGLVALALLVGGSVPASANAADAGPTMADGEPRDPAPPAAAITPLAPPIPAAASVPAARPSPKGTAAMAAPPSVPAPVSSVVSGSIGAAAGRQLQAVLDTRLQQARGDERATLLMQVLRSDTSAAIRRTAAWGLERSVERADVTAALATALRNDVNAGVREMAAWALGGGDDTPAARAALLAALGGDKEAAVRETSAWALAQVADDARADDVERALTAALRDDAPAVRATSLWGLGQLGEGKAPAAVAEALADRDPRVRRMAAWVLFRREDPGTMPAIERALGKEEDSQVRVALIRALGTMGEASASTLARLLDSPDRDVRAAVVAALAGQHGGPWPMPMPRPRPWP